MLIQTGSASWSAWTLIAKIKKTTAAKVVAEIFISGVLILQLCLTEFEFYSRDRLKLQLPALALLWLSYLLLPHITFCLIAQGFIVRPLQIA